MGRNSQERKVIAEQTLRESVQKLGVKNPNWRNQFIRLYDEVLQAKLQKHNTVCQLAEIKNKLDSELTTEVETAGLTNAAISLGWLLESQEYHLGQAEEMLVVFLNSPGKHWNLKEVLIELKEWKDLQGKMLE